MEINLYCHSVLSWNGQDICDSYLQDSHAKDVERMKYPNRSTNVCSLCHLANLKTNTDAETEPTIRQATLLRLNVTNIFTRSHSKFNKHLRYSFLP